MGDKEEEDKYEVIMEMMKEVVKTVKEIRRDQGEYRDMFKDLREENRGLRTEIEKMKKRMEDFEKKIRANNQIMEEKINKHEKHGRKNNIIIKGMRTETGTAEQDVENLMEAILEQKIKTSEVKIINTKSGKNMIRVKLEDGDKHKVMKAKTKLKGKSVFIEDDMTREERSIQFELRKIAREEKKNGKEVKIGYQKLRINKQSWVWDTNLDKLIEVPKN